MKFTTGSLLIFLATLLAAGASAQTFEEQVVEMVNQERWDNGQLPPLKHCPLLDASAETHSDNMAVRDFFDHCDFDTGDLPWDRMVAAGYIYSWAGENIAAGYADPTAVMVGWMNSSGHRANILHTSFREVGVGYVLQSGDQGNVRRDTGGDCAGDIQVGPFARYWTQNFGARSTVYPVVIDREAYQTDTRLVDLFVYGGDWADEMRIRNAGDPWPDWGPFVADVPWTLSHGNGIKTVEVELRSGATVRAAADDILLDQVVTAVPGDGQVAWNLTLRPASPNPFRASTRLMYTLPEAGPVRLAVYDIAGRQVDVLVEGHQGEGVHETSWNGRSRHGAHVAPGIYFLRLETRGEARTTKVMLER